MATQGLEQERSDRLDLGTGRPPRRAGRWTRTLALVAVGALAGWAAHAVSTRPEAEHGPSLMAGSLEENLRDPSGPELVVTLFNTGSTAVMVSDVAPRGWDATSPPTAIPAGGSVEVPIDLVGNCRAIRSTSEFVHARVTSGGTSRVVSMRLPSTPAALEAVFRRRCAVPRLTAPTTQDILGTWVVEDGGPAFTGKMLFRFDADGTYRMDVGTHLDDRPGAFGRFTLSPHGGLRLTSTRGGECLLGHRARWRVGLLSAGRMHVRLLTPYDGFCSVDPGDVWIAKRVVS